METESKDRVGEGYQNDDRRFLHSVADLEVDETLSARKGGLASSRDDALPPADKEDNTTPNKSAPYKSRKPIWWTRLGQGKPTKGQKKAMQAMESTHQLPRLPYGDKYDWTSVFTLSSTLPWLEIGSGTGENILAIAQMNPLQNLIGAEMHSSGIGNCFQRIYQATQRRRYWQDYIPYTIDLEHEYQTSRGSHALIDREESHVDYNDESIYSSSTTLSSDGPYPNLRIFAGNGVKVLHASPNGSLDAVLITFPDPFPKQPSYRILQMDVLDEIARALRPGGGKLVVATDHDEHAGWARLQVGEHEGPWRKIDTTPELRTQYLPAVSKYEAKGWREGRTTKLLIYERAAT